MRTCDGDVAPIFFLDHISISYLYNIEGGVSSGKSSRLC